MPRCVQVPYSLFCLLISQSYNGTVCNDKDDKHAMQVHRLTRFHLIFLIFQFHCPAPTLTRTTKWTCEHGKPSDDPSKIPSFPPISHTPCNGNDGSHAHTRTTMAQGTLPSSTQPGWISPLIFCSRPSPEPSHVPSAISDSCTHTRSTAAAVMTTQR